MVTQSHVSNIDTITIQYNTIVTWCTLIYKTRNSSGDEIANVNFLYDDIVHAVKIL